MSRRPVAAGAALLVVLAGTTACVPESSQGRASRAAASGAVAAGDEYVALGDSYTAAPFAGPTNASDVCWQSEENYPHLLAEELDLELVDVSCGGATTDAVASPQTTLDGTSRPPQADALSESTDLVTISLGANDFGLFSALVVACGELAREDPEGSPCADQDAADGGKADRTIDQVRDRLVSALEHIVEAAPEARVVVVGYPQFAPDGGPPCDNLPFAAGDYAFARRVNELLVRAQAAAAGEVGVDFLDVFPATEGHDICAEDPWVAGATAEEGRGIPYHPYPEEQEAVATVLVEQLT